MKNSRQVFRANSPQVIHEVIDGEAILVNLDSGNYYSMDKLAAEIWNVVQAGASVETVIEDVAGRYQAAHGEIETAISDLLQQLQDEGLVVPVQAGSNSAVHNGANSHPHKQTAGEKPPFEVPVLQKYTDMEDLLALDPIHDVADSGWPNIPEGND